MTTDLWRAGDYPKGELPDELQQSPVISKGIAISSHAFVTANVAGMGRYPVGPENEEAFRIEMGDLLYRYIISQESTINGNPHHVFRCVNGMPAGVRVARVGFAMVDYSTTASVSDNQNPQDKVSIQIAGYGTGVYNGTVGAEIHSPIYLRLMPPEYCIARQIPRKQPGKSNPAVFAPQMIPVGQIRAGSSVEENQLDIMTRALDEIITDNPQAGMRALIDTVETTMLDNQTPLRKHLLRAGLNMRANIDNDERQDPVANGAAVEPLGQDFVREYACYLSYQFDLSRLLDDPVQGLVELKKLSTYLKHVIIQERLPIDVGHYYPAFLLADLQLQEDRILLLTQRDEIYHREYDYLGVIMKSTRTAAVNIPFMLAT